MIRIENVFIYHIFIIDILYVVLFFVRVVCSTCLLHKRIIIVILNWANSIV